MSAASVTLFSLFLTTDILGVSWYVEAHTIAGRCPPAYLNAAGAQPLLIYLLFDVHMRHRHMLTSPGHSAGLHCGPSVKPFPRTAVYEHGWSY